MRYHRSGKHIFTISGCPGSIGVVTGISAKGFALAINAVWSQAPFQMHNKPVLFKLRETLEGALSYEEALEDLSPELLTSPALITIVGSSNQQMACVERIPPVITACVVPIKADLLLQMISEHLMSNWVEIW